MHTSFEQHNSPSGWQRHLLALAIPLAVLLVMPSTSIAQFTTAEEDRSGRLEEVIVTATRRARCMAAIPSVERSAMSPGAWRIRRN